ncbi:MAG: hypothetical protein ACMXYG_02910 [Candidatus Woesearchaeota archaeon]
MTTLYEQLRFIDFLNNDMYFRINKITSEAEKEAEEVGLITFETHRTQPLFITSRLKYDPLEEDKYKKQILESWSKDSKIMSRIINNVSDGKEDPLETDLKKLALPNSGLLRHLPRKRDKSLNDYVDQMQELIGDLDCLQHRGILYPDNPVSSFLISAPFFTVLFSLPEISPISIKPFLGGLGVGLLYGAISIRKPNSELPWKKAQYIDNEVQRYYAPKTKSTNQLTLPL